MCVWGCCVAWRDVQKHAKGHMLLQKVYNHVDLLEVKYFGLQFTDNYDVNVSLYNQRRV